MFIEFKNYITIVCSISRLTYWLKENNFENQTKTKYASIALIVILHLLKRTKGRQLKKWEDQKSVKFEYRNRQ